ncbi:hypothetical protein [Quadrisphaera sp. INWT6]|uniref:hypothetical protein n=1 Tax=Quadrisphaera sp. INWT6 TaxID=2596917 RepID=UPI0018926F1A|nr:hypothetical protein [Quadrisphaera sp. INWT6]MBF5082434.1 hypothetical protein [Quadrisphaera sp. INWT6]
MSSLPVDDDASHRLRAVLTGVDVELAHLRELRRRGTAPDEAERALRARGEREASRCTAEADRPVDLDG